MWGQATPNYLRHIFFLVPRVALTKKRKVTKYLANFTKYLVSMEQWLVNPTSCW